MECSICLEPMGTERRRPKILPCGHTYCLPCLERQRDRSCSVDRKAYQGAARDLPDNYAVLQMADRAAEVQPRPSWCCECLKVADDACLDKHEVCSLAKGRAGQLAPLLETLTRDEATVAELVQLICDCAAAGLRSTVSRRLQQGKELLESAQKMLQDPQSVKESAWDQRISALQKQSGFGRDATALLAALRDPTASCSLVVRRGRPADFSAGAAAGAGEAVDGAGGEVAWRGRVPLAGSGLAGALLLGLLCDGSLRAEGGGADPVDGAADDPTWEDCTNERGKPSPVCEGTRVVRGKTWPAEWAHDGTPPGAGVVTATFNDYTCRVQWYCGTSHRCPEEFLRNIDPSPSEVPVDYRMEVVDVKSISFGLDIRAKTKMAAEKSLQSAQVVLGLHCNRSAPWTSLVLQQMTPTVEVLELISPLEQHVLAVKKMPRLRLLHVSLPRATLQQVKLLSQLFELPAFQRLELDCPFEAALPGLHFAPPLASFQRMPPDSLLKAVLVGLRLVAPTPTPPPPGLRWLRSGLHPLRSALSLIRAHAGTLEELELVAATTEPYGCPDLAGELRRCGLKKLRVLRLLRGSHCYVCEHNRVKCRIQKLEIYSGLLEAGAICEVECSECC